MSIPAIPQNVINANKDFVSCKRIIISACIKYTDKFKGHTNVPLPNSKCPFCHFKRASLHHSLSVSNIYCHIISFYKYSMFLQCDKVLKRAIQLKWFN